MKRAITILTVYSIIMALLCISCGRITADAVKDIPAASDASQNIVAGSSRISNNHVYVSSPSVDVDIKRDNVPYVDFPAPEISVPSVNSISPDFKVLLPEGITFEELFKKAEAEDTAITMDADEAPSVLKEEIHLSESPKEPEKDTESDSPSVNFIVTISGDSFSDMRVSMEPEKSDTPLTLYYKMSDYTYNGSVLHGACTPMTMINCLNKFNDNGACTLDETLDIAYRFNLWTPKKGMSAEGIFITTAALNELHGSANSVALSGPKDCDELGDIIDKGHTAGVCVDSSMLWKKIPDGYADHMIAILETDRRPDGVLRGFKIIDNGMGKTYLSADLYDECALGNKLGFCMVFGNPEKPPY